MFPPGFIELKSSVIRTRRSLPLCRAAMLYHVNCRPSASFQSHGAVHAVI